MSPFDDCNGLDNLHYMEIAYVDALNPNSHVVYFSSSFIDIMICDPKLYRYNDQNGVVTNITPGFVNNSHRFIEIALRDNDPKELNIWIVSDTLVSGAKHVKWHLMKSTNYGNTWPTDNRSAMDWPTSNRIRNSTSHKRSAFNVNPIIDSVYYFGSVRVASKNGFSNNSFPFNTNNRVHDDIHDIQSLRTSANGHNDTLLIATDGGIYLSINTNDHNEPIMDEGLNITQYYGLGLAENGTGDLIAGAQDNGAHSFIEGQFTNLEDGDGGHSVISSANPYRFIYTIGGGADFNIRGTNNGRSAYLTTTRILLSHDERCVFWGTLDTVKSSPTYGKQAIMRSDISTTPVTVTNLTGFTINSGKLQALVQSEIDPNYIYVGSNANAYNQSGPFSNRVFKIHIDSGTVQDISTNWNANGNYYGPVDNAAITDMAVRSVYLEADDEWEEELYVVLGGYQGAAASPGSIRGRVWKRNHNGSWHHYSHGFSTYEDDYPVNTIEIQYGDPYDVIYIGGDNGVMYREIKSQSTWQCYNNQLSNGRVTDLRIDRCREKLVASTLSRGLWEVDLVNDLAAPRFISITADTTIDIDWIVKSSIAVKNNSTLTVTGTMRMPTEGKIHVEPGSKLIVDGGTITNSCGKLWRGISAWGETYTYENEPWHQFDESKHGVVIIKNGALIENAYDAITLGKVYQEQTNGGGIVKATESTFKNNWRSVQFLAYRNWHGSFANTKKNVSYFRDCNFFTTRELNEGANGVQEPYAHISMWAVDGVRIMGCTFADSVDFNAPGRTMNVITRAGIFAVDATFNLDPYCNSGTTAFPSNPCFTQASADSTVFYNQNVGVFATNLNPAYTNSARGVLFDHNRIGFYSFANMNQEFYRNKVKCLMWQTRLARTSPFLLVSFLRTMNSAALEKQPTMALSFKARMNSVSLPKTPCAKTPLKTLPGEQVCMTIMMVLPFQMGSNSCATTWQM